MRIEIEDLVLETPCPDVADKKGHGGVPYEFRETCAKCGGRGYIITEVGQKILDHVIRHVQVDARTDDDDGSVSYVDKDLVQGRPKW